MKFPYPQTSIGGLKDILAGVEFEDPYRWLEADTEATREWQAAQARLTQGYVREWPGYAPLHQRVAYFSAGGSNPVPLPRYAVGHWFWIDGQAGSVVVGDEPARAGRECFRAGVGQVISWVSPAPNARLLAVGVCDDGSGSNRISLVDVETGELLPNPPTQILMDSVSGGVHWLPDSSRFLFTAMNGKATDLDQQVYLHEASAARTLLQSIAWTATNEARAAVVSRCGRYGVAYERSNSTIPVAIAELDAGPLLWKPFISRRDGKVAGHIVGEHFVAVTDIHAPRGRLISVPLQAQNPNDDASWKTLVEESDAVLRAATPVDGVIYLTELVDTYARIRILDGAGHELKTLQLPDAGVVSEHPLTIASLTARSCDGPFVFGYSTLKSSWAVLGHVAGERRPQEWRAPRIRVNGTTVEDHVATSGDGTLIPYRIFRREDVTPSPTTPTLIHAYGGFNVPFLPAFQGAMTAFVEAGGALVLAHLRGGGEFGLDWWAAGRFENKQNSYDDLYAVAEDLISEGRCQPWTLALTGHSNGGLMAGVAVTQRPDLWGAVIPRVPRLDLIGACRTGYGRRSTLNDRATDLEDPIEVIRLGSYSPYHQIRDGEIYPAVLVVAGETDPRCPPQDARKFTARLQAAAAGGAPHMLHVWANAGHGEANDPDSAIAQSTEWLAFVMRILGIENPRGPLPTKEDHL